MHSQHTTHHLSCHVIALSVWTRNFLQSSACYSVFTLSTDTKPSFVANHSECGTDFPKTYVQRKYRFTEFKLSLRSSYSHQSSYMDTNAEVIYAWWWRRRRRNFANNIWGWVLGELDCASIVCPVKCRFIFFCVYTTQIIV